MLRKLLAATLAALTLHVALAPPAAAAIGTPTELGNFSSTTTTSPQSITTSASCDAGSLIVVPLTHMTTTTAHAVSDSAGNTYSITATYTGATRMVLAYKENAAALGSGGTITASWTTNSSIMMAAYCVSGVATASALDKTGAGRSASPGPSFTLPTGTLAQANEIVFGTWTTNGSDGGVTSAGTSFTALTPFTMTSSTPVFHAAYKITSVVTDSNYDPAWNTSRNYTGNLWTFKEASGGGGATTQRGLLLGVGDR